MLVSDRKASLRVADAYIEAIVAAGLIGLTTFWFLWSYEYLEDDGFIHLEFARNLARGQGFSFHGVLTYGDTSPAWVIAQAALLSVIPDPYLATKVLSLAGVAFAYTGIFFLCRRLAGPDDTVLPWLTVLAISLNPFFVHWAFAGMEAVAAVGLLCWTVCLLLGARTPLGLLVAAALAGLAPLLRPEMIIFLGLVFPWICYRAYAATRESGSFARAAMLLAVLALTVAPVAIWIVYALKVFKSAIPNTNAAKKVTALESIRSFVLAFGLGFPFPALIVAVVGFRSMLTREFRHHVKQPDRWIAAAGAEGFLLCLVILTSLFYILNRTYVQTRYALVLGAALTVVSMVLLARRGRAPLVIGALAVVTYSLAVDISIVQNHVRNKVLFRETTTRLTSFIRSNIPANQPIAVFSIGQIALEIENPLIDMGGITQPEATRFLADRTAMIVWAVRQGAKYYLDTEPPGPCWTPLFVDRAPYLGWTFDLKRYGETMSYGLWGESEVSACAEMRPR